MTEKMGRSYREVDTHLHGEGSQHPYTHMDKGEDSPFSHMVF